MGQTYAHDFLGDRIPATYYISVLTPTSLARLRSAEALFVPHVRPLDPRHRLELRRCNTVPSRAWPVTPHLPYHLAPTPVRRSAPANRRPAYRGSDG
jgi:hypothetical protein